MGMYNTQVNYFSKVDEFNAHSSQMQEEMQNMEVAE